MLFGTHLLTMMLIVLNNIAATHAKSVDTFTLDDVPILTKQSSQIQPNLAYASAVAPVWTSDNKARWNGQQRPKA